MRNTIRHIMGTGVAVALAAACTETTGVTDALTDEDVAFLADEVMADAFHGLGSAVSFSLAGRWLDAVTEPINRSAGYTRACPEGGTISVTGSVSGTLDETGSGVMSVERTLILTDCVRSRGEVTFTINTDPSIVLAGEVAVENRIRTGGVFTKTGAFEWEADNGRSGRCEIDLAITWSSDGSKSVVGTFCGREVNRSRPAEGE